MKKFQLLFIPFPNAGHLIPTVELAKLLLNHHLRLSVTIIVIKSPNYDPDIDNYTHSVASTSNSLSDRIRFCCLPKEETEIFTFASFLERQIPNVKQAISKITQSESDSPRLVGIVLDMLCSGMIDVAHDFGVPSYIFFTSSAAYLGFNLHMQVVFDDKKIGLTEFVESGDEFSIPSLVNPFPVKALPHAVLSKEWSPFLLYSLKRFKEAKGFIVNTFFELESYAIESFSKGKIETSSAIYPVGPILNIGYDKGSSKQEEIMKWLDDHPASSVVFLCFGSKGSFSVDQVKEIANALEHSGYRFLWSLRRPPPTGNIGPTSDYENPQEVLPEGFLDRTTKIGKVIGWAPQTAILTHQAIGGFVSHCGWNSILESIWYGVSIAAWPMYAEQQFNAFEMVVELVLGVEVKMDYRVGSGIIVSCEEIVKGIKCVMEQESEKRKKVKEMTEKSRMALSEGGSSYICLDNLIKDLLDDMP